jgi:hypothetical protein
VVNTVIQKIDRLIFRVVSSPTRKQVATKEKEQGEQRTERHGEIDQAGLQAEHHGIAR